MSGGYWLTEVCALPEPFLDSIWWQTRVFFRTLFFFFFPELVFPFPISRNSWHFPQRSVVHPLPLLIKEAGKQKAIFTMLGGRGGEWKNPKKKSPRSFSNPLARWHSWSFTLIRNHLEALQQIESWAGSASWQVVQHKATSQLPNPLFDLCKPSLLLTLFNELCASPWPPCRTLSSLPNLQPGLGV